MSDLRTLKDMVIAAAKHEGRDHNSVELLSDAAELIGRAEGAERYRTQEKAREAVKEMLNGGRVTDAARIGALRTCIDAYWNPDDERNRT